MANYFFCFSSQLTNEGLTHLSLLTNLTVLSLRNNHRIRSLEPFVPLRSLRTLNLWRCGHIPNSGLAVGSYSSVCVFVFVCACLCACVFYYRLEGLCVCMCFEGACVRIRSLEPFVPLRSLRTLNLWRCGHIPNAGLAVSFYSSLCFCALCANLCVCV